MAHYKTLNMVINNNFMSGRNNRNLKKKFCLLIYLNFEKIVEENETIYGEFITNYVNKSN